MTTAPLPTTPTAPDAAEWLDAAGVTDTVDAVHRLNEAAEQAANDYKIRDGAYFTVSPGNGFTYRTILTRIPEPEAAQFGGNLLVAFTEFNVSMVISEVGFHMPHYVDEKTSLGPRHSAVAAALLTLFSSHLADRA